MKHGDSASLRGKVNDKPIPVRIDTDYLITASGVRHGVTMIHDVQLYT
jgi:hypothetical protein